VIVVMAGVLTTLAVWIWPKGRSPRDRLRAVGAARDAAAASVAAEPARGREPRAGFLLAPPLALAGFLLVGGLPGLAVGALLAGGALVVVHRRELPEVRRRRERVTADLPFAADLMVACLRAGQPVSGAVETTAQAIGDPLGERLAWVGAQIRLGADPDAAWAALADDAPLAPLARAMIRAAQSGAPVADVLTRLADDARQVARAAASAAVRKVGVQAVAPLGLCFLPAFVFLGIVPVVAALAGQILLP
jgi:pilus assembly protein TadC